MPVAAPAAMTALEFEGSGFTNVREIGRGAYGIVYAARWPAQRNRKVALKKVKLEVDGEGVPPSALREVSLLKELEHPCVVQLLDVQHRLATNSLLLVFEFVYQDLNKFIQRHKDMGAKGLPPETTRVLMFQLIAAVAHCHSHRVLHRDLKPENVLISEKGELKVADFGLSRVYTTPYRRYTNGVVTLWYRPPELLLGAEQYHTAVDVWSIGCMMHDLATLETLFKCSTEVEMLFRIFQQVGTPNEATWPGVSRLPNFQQSNFPKWVPMALSTLVPDMEPAGVDLFSRMLQCYPPDRIACDQALLHPYFNSIGENLRYLADL